MSEDLEGWKLYSENSYEVTTGVQYKEIVTHKIYIKEIDGVWYYKDVKDVKFNPYVEFKSYDGKGESRYGFLE